MCVCVWKREKERKNEEKKMFVIKTGWGECRNEIGRKTGDIVGKKCALVRNGCWALYDWNYVMKNIRTVPSDVLKVYFKNQTVNSSQTSGKWVCPPCWSLTRHLKTWVPSTPVFVIAWSAILTNTTAHKTQKYHFFILPINISATDLNNIDD